MKHIHRPINTCMTSGKWLYSTPKIHCASSKFFKGIIIQYYYNDSFIHSKLTSISKISSSWFGGISDPYAPNYRYISYKYSGIHNYPFIHPVSASTNKIHWSGWRVKPSQSEDGVLHDALWSYCHSYHCNWVWVCVCGTALWSSAVIGAR